MPLTDIRPITTSPMAGHSPYDGACSERMELHFVRGTTGTGQRKMSDHAKCGAWNAVFWITLGALAGIMVGLTAWAIWGRS